MPCLNPQKRLNPHYLPNKSNDFCPPPLPSPLLKYIVFDCGQCYECRRKRCVQWRFRLIQEYNDFLRRRLPVHFVTFTFDDEHLESLRWRLYSSPKKADVYDCLEDVTDNDVCTYALHLFRDRYRKAYGHSLKHFFITERGEKKGRIHLHGILFGGRYKVFPYSNRYLKSSDLADLWSYGFITISSCNAKTINYCASYVTKVDFNFSDFKPKILPSPGVGYSYLTDSIIHWHRSYDNGKGALFHLTSSGHKIAMIRYYKLKIFTELERIQQQLDFLSSDRAYYFKGQMYCYLDYLLILAREFSRSVSLGLSPRPKNFVPYVSPSDQIRRLYNSVKFKSFSYA